MIGFERVFFFIKLYVLSQLERLCFNHILFLILIIRFGNILLIARIHTTTIPPLSHASITFMSYQWILKGVTSKIGST